MYGTTTTVWAVMRKEDTRARALFTTADDAGAFAELCNASVRAEVNRFKVYPWNIPNEMFNTED